MLSEVNLLLFAFHFVPSWTILGNVCNDDSHCSVQEFCATQRCRKAFCNTNNDCRAGESCNIRWATQKACFETSHTESKEDRCPGGQPVAINQFGAFRRCNINSPCPGNELCNPKNRFCCTGLRTCRRPLVPEINPITNKPKQCMQGEVEIKGSCSSGSICEKDSGFCCILPVLNQECSKNYGCATQNAQCACDASKNCKCSCLDFWGYSVSADRLRCERARRRLSEQCQTSAECKSAFAECRSSKCQCRTGFMADTNGGCQPMEYRCGSNTDIPLIVNGQLFLCEKQPDMSKLQRRTEQHDTDAMNSLRYSDCTRKERYMKDSCPQDHYCVPFYDIPESPQHYKGFCCKKPSVLPKPRCPVGDHHPSSKSPNFGCDNCPATNYYCHEDTKITSLAICCPKACINPDDVYVNGHCYPTASYGQQCEVDGQCVRKSSDNDKVGDFGVQIGQNMKCLSNKCDCARGFIQMSARCVYAICTVGMQGDPLTGSDGKTMRCTTEASQICPQGSQCDPTFGVCCKKLNRCPYPYMESSSMCGNGVGCPLNNICYFTQANNQATVGICCQAPAWG